MSDLKITVNGEKYDVPDCMPINLILVMCDATPTNFYKLERYEKCVSEDGVDHFEAYRPVKDLSENVKNGEVYKFTYTGPCNTA